MKRIACILLFALSVFGQEKKIKTGLYPEDWKYTLGAGVTAREVTYYSDGTACYAKVFFPKQFSVQVKTPAVVLGQGWAGTHFSIEKYGARFAERGLVAMIIDYRGWGSSDGFVSIVGRDRVGGDISRDATRFSKMKADVVVKRTRLLPARMIEDYRNAISYIQGEPGVDPERIGVWGSSFAGGLSVAVAGQDARVKAISIQVPAIAAGPARGPYLLRGRLLEDAILRAREGQGGEYETGYSNKRMIDIETQQAVAEHNPGAYLPAIGARPVMIVIAEKDELIPSAGPRAFHEKLTGPKDFVEVKGVTHFEIYVNEPFEISSKAAADWFVKYLEVQ